MAEFLDSFIDHIGKTLDNTQIKDYIFLICWVLGTYSLYLFLLAQKTQENIEDLKQKLPLTYWLLTFAPEPFKYFGKELTYQLIEKLKGLSPEVAEKLQGVGGS